MRTIATLVVAPLAFFLAACGAERPSAGGGSTGAKEPPPAVSKQGPGRLYEVNATVLESRTHGPMLCLGGVLESFPPQCGDLRITNWDWHAVDGEETAGGTVWGAYYVVGRYDGETFAVTDVGPYEAARSAAETNTDFTSPCAAPAGGWTGLEQATQEDARPAHAYAESQPDYVTSWVTHLDPSANEFGPVIVNAVFTGGGERHEAELRKIWGGPLCVVERDVPTARELDRIRDEAEASLPELGLRMLWSQGPGIEPVVEIGVVVDVGGRGQTALDSRFGRGVVRLIPALKPVS